MKVLLLHPEDTFDQSHATQHWDLVVDLGRAPTGTYDRWSRRTGCPVISIYDYAEETEDLYCLRELLQLGAGRVVDRWGIDWWDVFSLEIASKVQRAILVHRLSKELSANCDLYASRPDPAATALQQLLGAQLTCFGSGLQSMRRRVHRYYETLSRLGKAELLQLLEDKFDVDRSISRHFTVRRAKAEQPLVLLPSAYANVSRTALSYAALLPDQQFMLVVARRNGLPATVPPNVVVTSLTPYFGATDKHEVAALHAFWENLKTWLVGRAAEFKTAESQGFLGSASAPFGWGIALRDAWLRLFASEHVTACLSADDSNPNSRIPLMLAKKQGIPALACHHGALDFRMAIKVNHADLYLAKNEMERDYLKHVCHLAPEKLVIAAPARAKPWLLQPAVRRNAPWLVFFTEPYQSYGWRSNEVYRDLLPHLCALAQACGVRLVFKLHPFENVKGYRRMLRRLIPQHERQIEVLGEAPSHQFWNNTRFALTVQSSVALECAALGIPVFLCSWLRDPYSGYVRQYARFGVGHTLESSEQIAFIPELLESNYGNFSQRQATKSVEDPDNFARLLSGASSLPVASNASAF
ncbi:MAG TPA: hypothetical protein VNZ03_23405 [Terriglobales bacterium]|nr:hypothetical protein [Terriglobales bacterium]